MKTTISNLILVFSSFLLMMSCNTDTKKNTVDIQATIENRQAQVQQDKNEIRELLHSYFTYVDARDNSNYVKTFAKNGTYESPFATVTGHSEILKKIERWHESGITNNKRHFAGTLNSTISEDGLTATSNSNFWVAETKDALTIICTGYYEDTLVKEDGKWKLQYRKHYLDPSAPVSEWVKYFNSVDWR